MAGAIHEMAPHHLPPFIVGPGETDYLFVILACFLIAIVLLIGNFYFKLHALPEKIAHEANSTQIQLVGVLALLAMFTHNNIFWVAALLLAAFRIPNFSEPLAAISRSIDELTEKIEWVGAPSGLTSEETSVPKSPADPTISKSPDTLAERAASPASARAERDEAGDAWILALLTGYHPA
jgi:hypothetical protein